MTKRRQITLLPQVHQTDALKRFFNSTVDQLFDDGKTEPVSGYIGRKPDYYDPAKDFYKPEPTDARAKYQLEPMMISKDSSGTINSQLFYEDLVSNLNQEGAITSNPNRLFGAGYYSWAPPIDIDRVMNFQQYYWAGADTASLVLTVPGLEIGSRYVTDGYTTEFDLPPILPSRTAAEEDFTVILGGVRVTPDQYVINSDFVSFHRPPSPDHIMVVFRYGNVANGTQNVFNIPAHCVADQNLTTVYVFLNGLETLDFTVSGDQVILDTPPALNTHVMVTRIKELRPLIEGRPQFDPHGLTLFDIDGLTEGMKLRLVDPASFLIGYDLKAYGHPWDEIGYSTYFVENVDISIILIPVGDGLPETDPRYVVMARTDKARSFWSRVNRWVHRDALIDPSDAKTENRAKRPIIEFLDGLKQFNYGSYRIQNTSGKISSPPLYFGSKLQFTDINGLPVGSVTLDDGFVPIEGDVIFVNLPNSAFNNRLYRVEVVTTDNDPTTKLYLLEPMDQLQAGAITQIRLQEYWFDGANWNTVAAPGDTPIFDLFDQDGISLADPGVYPKSTFSGTRIFSYADGTGLVDPILGKQLRHDKYGQIVFENELETRRYSYRDGEIAGYYYYERSGDFQNAWHLADAELVQQIDANNISDVPLNLQANPDFETPTFFSRNDFFAHFASILENQIGFTGRAYSANNWYKTKKDVTKGLVIIQHQAPLLKLMALIENRDLSLPVAIRFIEREYTRLKAKFLKHVVEISRDQDATILPSDTLAVMALGKVNAGKTVTFPFHDSLVGGGNFFIPLTPSLMGLAPLTKPETFVDDTFGEPITFLRGHDGSCTALFGDIRDDALMALETRIYKNALYRTERMRLDDSVSGKYRTAPYSESEFTTIMMPSFELWVRNSNANLDNTKFSEDDPFSWNYSSCSDRDGNSVLGHWRGIYLHYFDTDKPHLAPWEMLGFAQRPTWWEKRYGAAPYTRANTILWRDIEAGVIKDGDRAGTYDQYKRPGLMQVLPVDLNGRLLDPVAATIVLAAPPVQFARQGWQFGDGCDVEAVWRYTSGYQFSLSLAKFLMRPAYFVERFWDILNETVVHSTQTVQLPQLRRIHHREILINGEVLADDTVHSTLGIQNWIVDHLLNSGKTPALMGNLIRGLSAQLGHKMAGFTTADRMAISAESFGLVPSEDIAISLYRSPSMKDFFYSGMLISNTPGGWRVVGYNPSYPFFDVISGEPGSKKIKITSKGTTSDRAINRWLPLVYYKVDMLVEYQNDIYRCIGSHTSSQKFEPSFWTVSPGSAKQAVSAVLKDTKSSGIVSRVEYGVELRTKQEVADLIFGYERWLIEQGFVFDEAHTWMEALRNFLKWSEVEWSDGAFMAISPAARQLTFSAPTGIVVEIKNSLINRTGHSFSPESYSVDRSEDETLITALNDDIYGARLQKSEYEHVLIFSNRTIFDDVIFDPLFNVRQVRLKMSARRAGDWLGRYEASGFILKGNDMVPNFHKSGEDIREMFDIELADNTVLRDHARSQIGFAPRPYLDQLLMSETQQFELYQGMTQQKGSAGALSTILRSQEIGQNLELKFLEEWAFRVGTFGAYYPNYSMEFSVYQSDIHNEQQIIHFNPTGKLDWLNLTSDRWVTDPADFSSLLVAQTPQSLPDAGYVRTSEVTYIRSSIDGLGDEISAGLVCTEGQTLWITHGDTWNVLRFTYPTTDILPIAILRIDDDVSDLLENVQGYRVTFDRAHNLVVGDFLILSGGSAQSFNGRFEVTRVGDNWIEIDDNLGATDDFTADSNVPPVALKTSTLRVADNTARDALPFFDGTFCYVDGTTSWTVYKKIASAWVEVRRQGKKILNDNIVKALIYDHASELSKNELKVEPSVPEKLVVVDPLSNLIPGIVDRELDYKLEYDPADYDDWGPEQVGMTWWNLTTARFLNYYTDALDELSSDSTRYTEEMTYRASNWARLTTTSTADIYEWVRSTILDTSVTNFVQRTEYDIGLAKTVTAYYFWSLNPSVVPPNSSRKLSAQSCSTILQNPSQAGLIWYAVMSAQALLISGTRGLFDDAGRIFQIDHKVTDYEGEEHAEWLLLRPGDRTVPPSDSLWNKLMFSLRGCDVNLKTLPDPVLHESQKSGLGERQSVFGGIDLSLAKDSFVTMLNYILARANYSQVGNLDEKLNLSDLPPKHLCWSIHEDTLTILPPPIEYDVVVYAEEDIEPAITDTNRVLFDNRLGTNPSWSLWHRRGGIIQLVTNYEYSVDSRASMDNIFHAMNDRERVLIKSDDSADGFWTIWEKRVAAWATEPFEKIAYEGGASLGLVNAQKYRTDDFWSRADWYQAGESPTIPPTVSYETPLARNVAEGDAPQNDFVKVLEDDGWAWTRFQDGEWVIVAKENATIQLHDTFATSTTVYGVRDEACYIDVTMIKDRNGIFEIMPLTQAIKKLLTVEQINEIWFSMIHFIHAHVDKVDWATKTSFLNVMGYNERLWEAPVATKDKIPLLLEYIDEVKPYRVKVRDILRTASPDIDMANTIATDFDQPVYFDHDIGKYRVLTPRRDGAILAQGIYRHSTQHPDKIRQTKIRMLFDRIWAEDVTGSGAAERIMAYYQPGSNMRAKSIDELLNLDFVGTIYDGASLRDTDQDVVLKGGSHAETQADINVSGGYKLRHPGAKRKPEELASVGMHDGLIVRATDKWGNGSPQHTVRYYDTSRRRAASASFDVGMLADSVAVFRDGIRLDASSFTFDRLGCTVNVHLTYSSMRAKTIAIHGFGPAAVDGIKQQSYYSGASSYNLKDCDTGYLEAWINDSMIDQSLIGASVDTVTLPAATASDSVMLTMYSSMNPRPIRMNVENLTYNSSKQWTLTKLPELHPYHSSAIVEKNGVRLTPVSTYYSMKDISCLITFTDMTKIHVWDSRTAGATSFPVVDITTLSGATFGSPHEIRDALGTTNRFVLWGSTIVFCDDDAASRDYVITVEEGQDFTLDESGILSVPGASSGDTLSVTTFSNDAKADIRTHVFKGNLTGVYEMMTKRHGRAWLTLNGKRLIENIDFYIRGKDIVGNWDIAPFEAVGYDTFHQVEIVIRFPGEPTTSTLVVTTFEGYENNPETTWQISSRMPEEKRLIVNPDNAATMYVTKKGWEVVSFDKIRRSASLTQDIPQECASMTVSLNPQNAPVGMIPSQPLMVPDETTPGVIWVGSERIEYFGYDRTGNNITLSQLRRGTRGTAKTVHASGEICMAGHELDSLPPCPQVISDELTLD